MFLFPSIPGPWGGVETQLALMASRPIWPNQQNRLRSTCAMHMGARMSCSACEVALSACHAGVWRSRCVPLSLPVCVRRPPPPPTPQAHAARPHHAVLNASPATTQPGSHVPLQRPHVRPAHRMAVAPLLLHVPAAHVACRRRHRRGMPCAARAGMHTLHDVGVTQRRRAAHAA